MLFKLIPNQGFQWIARTMRPLKPAVMHQKGTMKKSVETAPSDGKIYNTWHALYMKFWWLLLLLWIADIATTTTLLQPLFIVVHAGQGLFMLGLSAFARATEIERIADIYSKEMRTMFLSSINFLRYLAGGIGYLGLALLPLFHIIYAINES